MNITNLLLDGIFKTDGLGKYKFLENIVIFLNNFIVPITITLAVAAAIFVIAISVAIVKAETGEQADAMKKRLWQVLTTIVVLGISVWLLGWVLSNIDSIISAFRGQ